jgi:hypothetical protein
MLQSSSKIPQEPSPFPDLPPLYESNLYSNYSHTVSAMQAMTPMVDPRYSRREPTLSSSLETSLTSSVKGMLDDYS